MKKIRLVSFLLILSISVVFFLVNGRDEPIEASNWNDLERIMLEEYEYLESFSVELINDETVILLTVSNRLKISQENRVFRDIKYYFYTTKENSKDTRMSMIIISDDGDKRKYEYTNGDNWVINEE